jgi:hypothetical protein
MGESKREGEGAPSLIIVCCALSFVETILGTDDGQEGGAKTRN